VVVMSSPAPFGRKYVHPSDVVSLLLSLAAELDTASKELDQLEEDLVKLSEAHSVAHTAAFLLARANKAPQYECDAVADQASADEHLAMAIQESKVKSHKRRVETISKRISVGQTACKTLQAEIDLARMPGVR
jgi:hypothetical protein